MFNIFKEIHLETLLVKKSKLAQLRFEPCYFQFNILINLSICKAPKQLEPQNILNFFSTASKTIHPSNISLNCWITTSN